MFQKVSHKIVGFGLIGVMVFVFLVVMNMALSKATIIVEPDEKTVNADMVVTVREANLGESDILGKMATSTVSHEASFTASGTGTEVPAKASGKITVYNNSTKSQALIATTRFLSGQGVLFRLKKAVTVPAGGTVEAEIAADKEGSTGEVAATTFTIPGLAVSLQKKIYGKSTAAMTGGTVKSAVVSQVDIDAAEDNLEASLLAEVSQTMKTDLLKSGNFSGVVFKDSIKSKIVSAKTGDQVTEFKVKMELEVVGVAYGSGLEDQAGKTLSAMVATDRKLTSSNALELKPSIESYNLMDKSAILKASVEGKTIVTADSSLFDRTKLAGMNSDEVKSYLQEHVGVKNVSVKFFPFWQDRVPKLRDHIKIVVK